MVPAGAVALTQPPWRALAPAVPMDPVSLRETLLGGQSFRWEAAGDGVFEGVFGTLAVAVRIGPDGLLEARPLAPAPPPPWLAETAGFFAAATDFPALAEALAARDAHLAAARARFPHLRILRQPLGEALLAFVCSSNKQIVGITRCCAALARAFGAPAAPGRWALPEWARLAEVPEEALRACGLGYRAAYVAGTARFLAARPGWLEEAAARPWPANREALTALPGVGPKVAACALLFGVACPEAFPVDVWIARALARRYGLGTLPPKQLEPWLRERFAPHPGYAQQLLFASERAGLATG